MEEGPFSLANGSGVPPADLERRPATPLPLDAAVRGFSASVAAIRHEALPDDHFVGLNDFSLRGLLKSAERLRDTARESDDPDVSRFGVACAGFLEFVLEKQLFNDVRVVNFLDNASLTLYTAVDTRSVDDLDSLQQTAELLSNPAALLESASNTKG
jgi:hypothetical protein